MGLSGPRQKQKIGNDPRNLTWSDNATHFGHAYLSNLGWTSAFGLGAEMNGTTRHIPIAQKLNMLGIGADNRDGPEAIAWKQNQDFEGVLKRLNSSSNRVGDLSSAASGLSNTSPTPLTVEGSAILTEDDEEVRRSQKRARREEKRRMQQTSLRQSSSSPRSGAGKPAIRLAHRARNRAAKSMIGLSAAALAEVLGESSTSVTPATTSGTTTPRPTLTPISDTQDPLITTSSISMNDYFKSRLRNKVAPKASDNLGCATPTNKNQCEHKPNSYFETEIERKGKGSPDDEGVTYEQLPSSLQLPIRNDRVSEEEAVPRKKKKKKRSVE